MRLPLLIGLLGAGLTAQAEWRVAEPGWAYEFPRDHGGHADFKTEWWYFTGNLRTPAGREFGYQLTFFRQGIGITEDVLPLSRFVTRELKFAHFTVSDLQGKAFHCFQEISRGAYGEAGFDDGERLAWIGKWNARLRGEEFQLHAERGEVEIDLTLRPLKPFVIHGADGVSRKGAQRGEASHYYSATRMATSGTVRLGAERFPVLGESWFDHEWATNQLAEHQTGWDWFSLQFADGSDLMLFQLRTKDGGRDPHSAGTFIDASGQSHFLGEADFELVPGTAWKSPQSGAAYPVNWKMRIPSLALDLEVSAASENQELNLQPVVYWEGAIRARGSRAGRAVDAVGYLEMTGYAGPVPGLQSER